MHKNKIKTKRSFSRCVSELSQTSMIIICVGLPLVAIALLMTLSELLSDIQSGSTYIMLLYPSLLEIIMQSLCLVLVGALVFDMLDKR